MLWKKESTREDALYVNIFRAIENDEEHDMAYRVFRNLNMKPKINKSDEKAFEARMQGNNQFKNKKWNEAMVSYNASLCLAHDGSENISLAYANRASCYYQLKKYKQCLIDIKLAKEAGYPQHLMPKLDKREADCLKHIEGKGTNEFRLKLSFESNENFPCLANVLEFSPDENGIPSVVATEDIDVGQVVAVERFFSPYVFDNAIAFLYCNICLMNVDCTNLVPCKKCTVAMFCHDECQHKALHQFECGSRFCDDDKLNGNIMRVVRTILIAIDLFPNTDDLMNFVEEAVNSDPNEIPDSLLEASSMYLTFLKLRFKKAIGAVDVSQAYYVYKALLEISKVNSMFQTKKHQRFLMHLICHHAKVTVNYSAAIGPTIPGCGTIVLTYMGIIRRYFKLSCTPNVIRNVDAGSVEYLTVRPIKKGDRLTVLTFSPLLEPKEERQKVYEEFDYVCKCVRCEGVRPSPEQKKELDMDPLYRSILLNYAAEQSDERFKSVFDKCATFLRKYGEFPWCEEIGRVIDIYINLSYIRYADDKNPLYSAQ